MKYNTELKWAHAQEREDEMSKYSDKLIKEAEHQVETIEGNKLETKVSNFILISSLRIIIKLLIYIAR